MAMVLFLAIIFSSSVFVFADDETAAEVPDGTSASVELSESEIEFINDASSDSDRDIRTLAVEVVRATSSTYTIDDIYNLLVSVYTTYTGRASWAVYDQSLYNLIVNNFSHYDSGSGNTYDTGNMLWTIRDILSNLQLELVPATASISPTIYEILSDINTAINSALTSINYGLVDSNNTPYLVNIYNKLNNISSGMIDYTSALFYNSIGVAEYASRINTAVANLNGIQSLITASTNNLKESIDAVVTNTRNIKTNTDTLISNTNTIHNDLGSNGAIASGISSLKNDINNISWQRFVSSGVFDINENPITTSGNYSNLVFKYSIVYSDGIMKCYIPLYVNNNLSNININIGVFNNGTFTNLNNADNLMYYIEQSANYGFYVYIIGGENLNLGHRNICIKVSNRLYWESYRVSYLDFLSHDSSDYYQVYSWFLEKLYYDTWKSIYASDDIIAAKQNQQPLEDAVLDDFTGSGSASASLSDAVDVKGVQSSIKGSLNTGDVKASGLSTILNTSNPSSSNSFFSFFTSSVYNDINGINNIPQTRDVYIYLNDRDTFNELVGSQSW